MAIDQPPTLPTYDHTWNLNALRGDINNDAAYAVIRAARALLDDGTLDPESRVALNIGDTRHPDDQRRFEPLDRSWDLGIDEDPGTAEHIQALIDANSPFVNWPQLFTEDTPETEWLYDGVLALGRGHAIYAEKKQGKSLFTLWMCADLAVRRADVDIIYLDYEMTRADLRERLEDMGYGPESDLGRLHYALLPTLPPLDTGEGAAALLDLADSVERPGCPLLVIVDTTSRAVEGKENDNDTIRGFYQWSGISLKRRGITWARVDHAGKDPTRGQRGGSAKGDDVDIVWRLQKADNGIVLYADAARMAWVDTKITFQQTQAPLTYKRTGDLWPAGTKEMVTQLDELGVPSDATRDKARAALREAGITATNVVLSAAVRWRKQAPKLSEVETDSPKIHVWTDATDTPDKPSLTWTDNPTDSLGQRSAVRGPESVSIDTDRSNGHPTDPPCTTCGGPPHTTSTHTYTPGF